MALHISEWTPSSSFHTSHSFSDRLNDLRSNPFVSKSPSIAYHRSSHFTDDIVSRLDRIDILGGEDANGEVIGHTGCVNALAWSQSGHCLATGSDDRRIILWKLGSSDEHPRAIKFSPVPDNGGYPRLDIAQSDVIETGHRANIFNVKWAPNCSDQRLLSVAGDNEIRIFDLNKASSVDHRLKSGKEYKLWEEHRACSRVLRCHTGRVKKISTENSPDIFLTAAEDGEVRQTDLRVPHTCSRSQSYGQGCPRPLMQFKMELYSISVSIQEPWLFAICGTSDRVYLQDRRMIPRLLKEEWGSKLDAETAALTHCVRRFCREPKVANEAEESPVSRIYGGRAHVTAVKISEANGRDLLASYSGDGVYRFDIKGDPGSPKKVETSILPRNKRQKTSSGSVTPQPEETQVSRPESPVPTPAVPPGGNEIRRRIFSALFSSPESDFTSELSDQLIKDLEALLEEEVIVTGATNATELRLEEGTMALCRLLAYIRKTTAGQSVPQEWDLEDHIMHLQGTLTKKARLELITLIEDMQYANANGNHGSEVRSREILWREARFYVNRRWKIEGDQSHWVEDEEEEEESDLEMESDDDDSSVAPPDADLDTPQLIATRQRIFSILFQGPRDFTAETYTQLEHDFDQLIEGIPDAEYWTEANEDRCIQEQGTIDLCKMLIYIKKSTSGPNDMVNLNLDRLESGLWGSLTRFGHGELMPVIEQLKEANQEGILEEDARLRRLLWKKSERYIKSQWSIDGFTEDDYIMGEENFDYESRPDSDVVHQLDRFDAISSDEEEDYSDDDDDEEFSTRQFSESGDDQPEIDRHGISGGNDAPFVYPNGCFTGHANNETVKDCGFIGSNDEYIWSGSDDGHFFIWTNDQKRTLMGIWKGDGSVVNCLSQHPVLPICAVSGIDDTIKIFGPVSHGSQRITDVMDRREEIMRRNTHQGR
jgi:WD40 repeat protein